MNTKPTAFPLETSDADALQPVQQTDGWMVQDPKGGVWHPDDDAMAEIEAADDPALAALVMCEQSPMRGTWHC